jgi:peroxiredoxin
MGKSAELRLIRQKQKITIFVLTGLGLVFLAVGILMVILSAGKGGMAASLESMSTVPVEVNYPAPDLSLENINGNMESLADFQGKVILVNNWATWCPPCRAEMPTLVAFFTDHAQDGLMIIAIEAGAPKEKVQKFVDQFKMPFHVWLDPKGDSASAFKNNYLPNSYVIDRTGTIRLTWTGEINRETLEKYVSPIINEN